MEYNVSARSSSTYFSPFLWTFENDIQSFLHRYEIFFFKGKKVIPFRIRSLSVDSDEKDLLKVSVLYFFFFTIEILQSETNAL